MALCDDVITLNTHYSKECTFERNRYLLNNSEYLLGVHDCIIKDSAFHMINYAREKSKEVIIIDPNSLKVTSKSDLEALEQRNLIKLTKSKN